MDDLPQDIQLVRSWPRPLAMMEGIDNHTVRFVGSIIEISMIIEFTLGYLPTMN